MFNINLPVIQTENHLEITLCGKGSCKCPSLDIDTQSDHVVIGGEEEGYTTFTKEQFSLGVLQIYVNSRYMCFIFTLGVILPF